MNKNRLQITVTHHETDENGDLRIITKMVFFAVNVTVGQTGSYAWNFGLYVETSTKDGTEFFKIDLEENDEYHIETV